MKCEQCPITGDNPCLGKTESFPFFCEWAAEGDDTKRRHIVARSQIGDAQPEPAEYPSLFAQAGNALGSLAAFVADGCKQVDEAEAQRRLEVCRTCEHFDAEPIRCRQCGCYLAIKTYARAMACPVGKW